MEKKKPVSRHDYYILYEAMEYNYVIAAALDSITEKILGGGVVITADENVKNELENLFYGVANLDINLFMWVRNTLKYGDNYVYIASEKGRGVTILKQLIVHEIVQLIEDDDVRYKHNQADAIFYRSEMINFKIIKDQSLLPYGDSILKPYAHLDNLDDVKDIEISDKEIHRIKQAIIQGLNKLAVLHLFCLGEENIHFKLEFAE